MMGMNHILLGYRQSFIKEIGFAPSHDILVLMHVCLYVHVEGGAVCVYIYVEITTSGVILGNDTCLETGSPLGPDLTK